MVENSLNSEQCVVKIIQTKTELNKISNNFKHFITLLKKSSTFIDSTKLDYSHMGMVVGHVENLSVEVELLNEILVFHVSYSKEKNSFMLNLSRKETGSLLSSCPISNTQDDTIITTPLNKTVSFLGEGGNGTHNTAQSILNSHYTHHLLAWIAIEFHKFYFN